MDCPTASITKDGLEQTQAGRSASASRAVSCPERTAPAAALAAGAKPPREPMSSTRPAAGARTPMSLAAGQKGSPSTSAAGHWMSSVDTMRNGNSESSSGPPQSASPSRRACAQASGAANGSRPAASAIKKYPTPRIFSF